MRAVPGLVAADYFAPGYFVFQNLAKIGYEEKNLHMAAYDWRLSFQNTEVVYYSTMFTKYNLTISMGVRSRIIFNHCIIIL